MHVCEASLTCSFVMRMGAPSRRLRISPSPTLLLACSMSQKVWLSRSLDLRQEHEVLVSIPLSLAFGGCCCPCLEGNTDSRRRQASTRTSCAACE